jgi:hypothetical protein
MLDPRLPAKLAAPLTVRPENMLDPVKENVSPKDAKVTHKDVSPENTKYPNTKTCSNCSELEKANQSLK